MARLSQCVPILDVKDFEIVTTPMENIREEDKNLKEIYNTLDKIHVFAEVGSTLFSSDFGIIGDVVREKYESYLSKIFQKYEKIPDKYGCVEIDGWSRYSKNNGYNYDKYISTEKKLSVYPMTTVKAIKTLADKLNMIIVPIEFVDLPEIFRSIEKINDTSNYYNRSPFSQNCHYRAIKNAQESLIELSELCNLKSQMYILCPMSYYSFWNEISSTLSIDKYYPIDLESIFMTIDLMLPAQRNLYSMSKTNETNYKNLANELQRNIEMIGQTLRNMETRVSTLESQMDVVRQKQKEQEIEISRLKEVESQMQQMMYRMLDPLVFYVHNEAINFRDENQLNRKAHLVSCFGPEFPVEFLESNGIMIYNMKDILKYN